jgi:putative CocE/NonD family hydrolase
VEIIMNQTITVERNIPIPMRDGIKLYADIYRPEISHPVPVLLERTPYGKGFSETSFALFAAEQGYAVVLQDTRGRWASEGDGYPFLSEKEDGFDTLDWLVNQMWCNGKVGMFGGSYVGYTQYAAAASGHPALKTIIPAVTFVDANQIFYSGGAAAWGAALTWSLLAGAQMAILREPISEREKAPLWGQFIQLVNQLASGETFNLLPPDDIPLVGKAGLAPFLADAMKYPPGDAYWQRISFPHQTIRIPAFHIGGWYDIFIHATLNDYHILTAQGSAPQKLMVGPWHHGSYDSQSGEVDFGLQASAMMVLPEELQMHWFDAWLMEKPGNLLDEPPVRIFVMGDNQWRTENEWPLARTKYTPFFLHSGGKANSLHGDGVLNLLRPKDEPVDQFIYDPRNPIPTRGGGLCCWNPALPPGAYDQRPVEERPDVLVYTMPLLEQDLEITGPISMHLWAASSAVDTDFTAKLVDVGPCGYARNVGDGILRARYRIPGRIEYLNPGEPVEFLIDLNPTSNVFKAGHRLRLEISSSNFPRYDRNPNTGMQPGESIEMKPALQTVFHETDRASYLLLPVIAA